MFEDFKAGKDISKYKTTGTEDKRVVDLKKTRREDESPVRYPDNSMMSSTKPQA